MTPMIVLFGFACGALGFALALCFTRRNGSGGEGLTFTVLVGPEEEMPDEKKLKAESGKLKEKEENVWHSQ